MGLVAIAMMAGATGTTTVRVTGIGIGIGTGIVEAGGTADSIAPTLRDLRRLTDAKMATPYKTVSANHTGATKGIIVRAISPPLAIRPSDAALGSRTFHAGYPRLANQMPSTGAVGRDWRWVLQTIKFKVRLCAWPLFAGAIGRSTATR
jgi:hypothetical protein